MVGQDRPTALSRGDARDGGGLRRPEGSIGDDLIGEIRLAHVANDIGWTPARPPGMIEFSMQSA
jgi:hypothetical protein